MDVAKQMEWSYVILLHSNDEYGTQGAAAVEAYGKLHGICFTQTISVDLNCTNKVEQYENITRQLLNSDARGTIYFGQEVPCEYYLPM